MLRYKTLLTHLGEKAGLNTKPGLLETLLQSPSFTSYFSGLTHRHNLAQSESSHTEARKGTFPLRDG